MDPPLGLYAVADGMGGHSSGEVAARIAVEALQYYIGSTTGRFDASWPFGYNFDLSVDANRLVTGVQLAHRQIWRQAEEDEQLAGMGTTIAAVLLAEARCVAANVGDSRVYLFRRGELRLLSMDHTWVSQAARRGLLSPGELVNHPMRNVLTQAIGSGKRIEVHTQEVGMVPGDLLLLCSDGLHGVIGDDAIRSILGSSDLATMAPRLIGAARSSGAPDNVSCVALAFAG